jgi:ATP-binding cassette subfamily E protein 1
VIKRFILHAKKTAFIVEHDFIMATYLADRVVVFSGMRRLMTRPQRLAAHTAYPVGIPSIKTRASAPKPLVTGMNEFLESLDVTFRRDPTNYRPRINKVSCARWHECSALLLVDQ